MSLKVYIRPGSKEKKKEKKSIKPEDAKNPSAVAFILRHISSHDYDEAMGEAQRLMEVVNTTPKDREVIKFILKRKCRKSQ